MSADHLKIPSIFRWQKPGKHRGGPIIKHINRYCKREQKHKDRRTIWFLSGRRGEKQIHFRESQSETKGKQLEKQGKRGEWGQ